MKYNPTNFFKHFIYKMIDSQEFIYSFVISGCIGSFILIIYSFTMLKDTNKETNEWLTNIIDECNLKVNECNLKLKNAKYSERLKFATLITMRLKAYNTAIKTRQESINKLTQPMSISLEDIIQARKTIKKMETKLYKYSRKMSKYPVFHSMFAFPQKNDYMIKPKEDVATNGETRQKVDGNTQ